MLDLHAHVLPGIDDGARNVSGSIEMLKDSYSQGVRLCAATPHCVVHCDEDVDVFLSDRRKSFDMLKSKTEGMTDIPKLLCGAEVYLDNDINSYKNIDTLCFENTNIIMLEFPVSAADARWAEWIYNLNRKGLKILVAHVDRYPEWDKMMADFKGLDVAYQINASRFVEFASGRLVKSLMAKGHKYIVSSDMHNMKSRRCNMKAAFEKVKKKYPDSAEKLFGDNGKRLLGL